MNDKGLEIWKGRFAELEEKVRKLTNDKNILINLLNEIKTKQGIKLNILLKDKELEEEISYLNGWIEFYKEKIAKCEKKIRVVKKEASLKKFDKIREEAKLGELLENKKERHIILEKETTDSFKFIFKEIEKPIKVKLKLTKPFKKGIFKEKIKEVKSAIEEFREKTKIKLNKALKALTIIEKEKLRDIAKKPLIKYAVPFIILLLIFTSIFFLKPAITGYITLTQGKTYDDNLDLIINESGNYTWAIDKTGLIESIKASGRVKGNGSVKVYMEKDGKKYLIFDNKKE